MDKGRKPRMTAPTSKQSASDVTNSPGAGALQTASLATPMRTPPLADDWFDGWGGGPDLTTALCEYNVAGEWMLSRDVWQFTLGTSRKCDIAIPRRGLSGSHCRLERCVHKLRIYDLDSTHGTFVRGRRIEGSAELSPGDLFTPQPVTFVCMNDEMRQHRFSLFEIIGLGGPLSPDWVMIQAVTGSGPLLLSGEAGCDLERLAHAIHAMSLRRSRALIKVTELPTERLEQMALIKQASRTTLLLSLTAEHAPLDPELASMLFDPSFSVRLIVVAPSLKVARRALSEPLVGLMQHVPVRPLADRIGDIDKVLDRMFEERQAPQLRVADLSISNLEALQKYRWPGNLVELRRLADAIVEHTRLGSLRPAARALGLTHQTLQRRFSRVGMKFPLFR